MLNFNITSFVPIPIDNFLLNGTLRAYKELRGCALLGKEYNDVA